MPICEECGSVFQNQFGNIPICPICIEWKDRIQVLEAENARLKAERRQDALAGQAALDEVNNENARLKDELAELWKAAAWYFRAKDVGTHTIGQNEEFCEAEYALRSRLPK